MPKRSGVNSLGFAFPSDCLTRRRSRSDVFGATTLPEIIQEMLVATVSERQGRVIDYDEAGSMEQKKKEGYF